MKIAIVGAGVRPGEPGFFLQEELRSSGIEITDGDVAIIPRSAPIESFTGRTRNTGAARIKRDAKQRRRRKGK